MSDLQALVYVSSAIKQLSVQEIEKLLFKARARNIEYGVTGVLLYIGGNFMQYIEGKPADLDLIYKIITEDPMHSGIIELMRRKVDEREFSNWSMAYCTKDRTVIVGDYNDDEILNGKLGVATYKETPARILLHNFWTMNRI